VLQIYNIKSIMWCKECSVCTNVLVAEVVHYMFLLEALAFKLTYRNIKNKMRHTQLCCNKCLAYILQYIYIAMI